MFLGCAIVLAMILYLVDKNQVWKQFFWIARGLFAIVVVVVAGVLAWGTWVQHRGENTAHAVATTSAPYFIPDTTPAAGTPIPEGATIIGSIAQNKPRKRFGNATVQADAAIVWNGMTEITVLFHPARVEVLGEKGTKYQVRLADGRTGEMDRNEIKLDAKAAIPNQDMKVLP